jgi:RHS repeat-associated protein
MMFDDRRSGHACRSVPRALGVCLILMSSPLMAGQEGETSSTSYWYGGNLHPLVITRDGVNYRLIGKSVVEMMGSQPTRTYAHADRLGSLRVVTDDGGAIVQSLGYDGDYGSTRINGRSAAATDDSMASFYRFQGQEQEIFPLAKLGIANDGLAQWLDRIELYHFPWRDYAPGLAAFGQTDPVPTDDSLYAALRANPVNVTDETGGIAVLSDTDTRRDLLLYELRRNGGVNLLPEDRRYLWNLLQEVRAETTDNIAKEVAVALPLWEKRYENSFQEWIEAIEAELIQDIRDAFPNHLFTQEDLTSTRLQAETIARFNRPNREVASALDELSTYELLDSPEKRASYESLRHQWLSTYERLIEDLIEADEAGPDLFQSIQTTPEPQAPSAQAPAVAAEEESSLERSAAQEEEEKAEFELDEHYSEKSREPHEPSGKLPDGPK